MKIIIVGAGRIGTSLAKSLAEENHEVYLVEQNEELADRIDEKIDAKVIRGSGADPATLKGIQVQDADLVIAVTTSDETNLLVCSLSSFYGAKRQIARVRNTSLSRAVGDNGFHHFHVDEIINPEEVAAQAIVKTIQAPGAREVGDFAGGRILLRTFDVPNTSPLCGLKMEELRDEDFPWPFLIIAISRSGTVVIPRGDAQIQAGDRIYVLLPAPSLGEFLTFVDPAARKSEKVIVFGATVTGEYVAQALAGKVRDIVLLEENKDTAEDVAARLLGVKIINGSASERDILTECGIEAADAFVATTNNDHSNLVSAVLAKKMGAKTTIIITQQPDYASIVGVLDINVAVNPHLLAVEQILRLVRGKGISAVTKLLECSAEALEFIPEEGSPITKAPLKDIKFPKNAIVGAVYSGEEIVLAKGDTHIKAGEKAIVFCQNTELKKLQRLFTR